MIEFKNVRKSFGPREVIKGVDLTVSTGEVVVICGPSGSGKSTLIRLVDGLEPLSGGDILIDGESVGGASPASLRRLRTGIGFVFQQFNLYPHLDVTENITLALRKLAGMSVPDADARAAELLERVGLSDWRHAMPASLSGGQQQRVAIARALAMQPKILLFDEPTSALDPEMIGEVLAVMRELAGSGITMLVVTHEMGFARELADRVVFIDQGSVLEDAPPARFFEGPHHPRVARFLSQILSPLHGAAD